MEIFKEKLDIVQNNADRGASNNKARTNLLKNEKDPGNFIKNAIEKAQNLAENDDEPKLEYRGGLEKRVLTPEEQAEEDNKFEF